MDLQTNREGMVIDGGPSPQQRNGMPNINGQRFPGHAIK
jgi:hypothetical protein